MDKTLFDRTVRYDLITYNSIQKISAGQGDDYSSGCLLDYNYFKNCYQMIAIDLSKQEALNPDNPDSKSIQEINFNGNLERQEQYFSLLKKQRTIKVM